MISITRVLFVIFAFSVLAKLFLFSQEYFLHSWDEKFHAVVAKNLISDPLTPKLYTEAALDYNYQDWTANHVWLHKMPLFLWESALSMKIFGTNLIAFRLPSILKILLLPFLVYFFALRLFDTSVAIWAYAISSFSFHLHMTAVGCISTDHNDISLLFYFSLSLVFGFLYSENRKTKYLFYLIAFSAAAVMNKWLVGLAPICIFSLLLFLRKEFKFAIILFLSTLPAMLPAFLWSEYITARFPDEAAFELGQFGKHIFEVIEGHRGDWHYYLRMLWEQYGPFIFAALVYAVYSFLLKSKEFYLLFFVPLVALCFFSFSQSKMPNYILILAPLL